MSLLVLGVVIWSLIHFIPASAVKLREGIVKRVGLLPYKGIFAVLAFAALLLMIRGWKAAPLELVFSPPEWGIYATVIANLVAFILFFAPYIKKGFSRVLRHPQLTGVVFFGVGHLFSNGEARSLVLFGGLALWALLEMWLLNRRDGAWTRPEPSSVLSNIRLLLTGIGFFAIFVYIHQWLFGVGSLSYL